MSRRTQIIFIGAIFFVKTAPCASPYHELVDRVRKGDLSVDFRALRFACLSAKDCDAGGDSKDKDIVAMHRAMQSKDFSRALKIATKLIDRGFTNIEAQAICSKACEALDNPNQAKFHHEVAAALIRSILSSGDGKSKASAFEVTDVTEEYVILHVLGFPALPVDQTVITDKSHSFDVLKVTHPKTGEKVSVYFNVDAFFPPKH